MNLQSPIDALKEMLTVTKQNGVIACEEGEVSACFTQPTCNSFQLLIHLILSLGEKNKIDFNIGPKLPDIFSKLHLEDISVKVSQPLITQGRHKYLSAMASREMKPSFLKYGLFDLDNNAIDERIIDAMTKALEEEVALNPDLIHGQCSVTQILGKKRHGNPTRL